MFDTTFQTAVAQAELEDRDHVGHYFSIAFKAERDSETIIVKTTRPELLPACVALVAHPDDKRYKGLFGQGAVCPLLTFLFLFVRIPWRTQIRDLELLWFVHLVMC